MFESFIRGYAAFWRSLHETALMADDWAILTMLGWGTAVATFTLFVEGIGVLLSRLGTKK